MADALVLVEVRERRAVVVPRHGERVRTLAVRDAALPVEPVAAGAPERRHEVAQLRVHRAAVVALVVVLREHLPVRRDLVA